jgi:hypothetical protein
MREGGFPCRKQRLSSPWETACVHETQSAAGIRRPPSCSAKTAAMEQHRAEWGSGGAAKRIPRAVAAAGPRQQRRSAEQPAPPQALQSHSAPGDPPRSHFPLLLHTFRARDPLPFPRDPLRSRFPLLLHTSRAREQPPCAASPCPASPEQPARAPRAPPRAVGPPAPASRAGRIASPSRPAARKQAARLAPAGSREDEFQRRESQGWRGSAQGAPFRLGGKGIPP